MKIAQRITEAENLIQWLDAKIDGLAISSEVRFRFSCGCLDIALEHQKSIVLLVSHELYGSAFSVARLIFEAYVRGVWLHQCASDADLKRFSKNKLKKEFGVLIAEIEQLESFNAGILSAAKKRSWSVMNSFTHCGFHQVVRRNKEATIEPDYAEEEILEVVNFAGAIGLLSAIEIAHLAGNEALANEVLQKAKHVWSMAHP